MNKKNPLYILFFLFVVSIHSVQAASPVWKIVKGNQQLFIGGTIHILSEADYPLPPAFENAYNQSAILVFETDMQKIQTPEVQQFMLRELSYSDGRNLKTVLNEKTYQSLEQHFSQRGIPMADLIGFKPGMIAITMTILEVQRLGLFGMGVDEFYTLKALNDNKQLGQLETPQEQISFISDMGVGRENELIEYSIHDIKELPHMLQSMKAAWLKGDNNKLKELAITPIKKEFPKIYNTMFVKRNNTWIPKIEAMLKTKEIEFILVGAAHLVGNDGLLSQLASKGYIIQEQ